MLLDQQKLFIEKANYWPPSARPFLKRCRYPPPLSRCRRKTSKVSWRPTSPWRWATAHRARCARIRPAPPQCCTSATRRPSTRSCRWPRSPRASTRWWCSPRCCARTPSTGGTAAVKRSPALFPLFIALKLMFCFVLFFPCSLGSNRPRSTPSSARLSLAPPCVPTASFSWTRSKKSSSNRHSVPPLTAERWRWQHRRWVFLNLHVDAEIMIIYSCDSVWNLGLFICAQSWCPWRDWGRK